MAVSDKKEPSGAKAQEGVRVRVKLGTVQTGGVEKTPDGIIIQVVTAHHPKGSIVDLPLDEAKILIDRGVVELASESASETEPTTTVVAVGSGKVYA